MEGQRQDNISEEKEIDLLVLVNKIWLKKKFILKVVGIAFILGLVVAFSIPKEYTTTVILTPDAQSASSGTIGSLAALAGVNINNNIDKNALASPSLYPSILSSTQFLQGMFNIQVQNSNKNMSLYTYIQQHQKKPWWIYILAFPSRLLPSFSTSDENKIEIGMSDDSLNTITPSRYIPRTEMNVIEILRSRFAVEFDKKTGITTIEVTMQNPKISSFLADTLTSYLQSYIIEYRTQKARVDLEYAEKLYMESKENYYNAQSNLAAFIDGNMNVVSARYKTTQEKLQNESSLAYSVYNQSAQQLQMSKIKVQNTTPVFTVIQPAVDPLYPSNSQKKTVLAFIFLSFIGASMWILKKDILEILR